jgi:sugar phosphate isomerase/epimerase
VKLGGQVFCGYDDPDAWARWAVDFGYQAVNPPFGPEADAETRASFVALCRRHGLVIAEVGVWNNPLSGDAAAIEKCKACLQLAEDLAAACCVNIAGSRGELWDGPDPRNLDDDTFDMIVAQTREIIRAVEPKRTVYSLETMPWVIPDSPETYLRLIQAVDMPGFGVHLDIVNMINRPERFFRNADFSRRCVELLRPWIRGVHLKDMRMAPKLTVHLDECPPGDGQLDLRAMLDALATLPDETPVLLEHMHAQADYERALAHVRGLLGG